MQPSVTNGWEQYVEQLRVKLPPAPEGLINGYVRWAPWVAIVFGAIGVLAFISLFFLTAAVTPFLALSGAAGLRAGGGAMFAALAGLVTSGLELVGGYFMLQRSALGWWILALGLAVSLITSLLSLAIFSLVIAAVVAYIHVQVRPQYH